MQRVTAPDIPEIDQRELATAAAALGIPLVSTQKLHAALILGKVVQSIGARVHGYSALLEVIETSQKYETDIRESYTAPDGKGNVVEIEVDPVEVAKARCNFIRLRLDAAKALIESDPKLPAVAEVTEKPKQNGTPRPGEVVGVLTQ
jgi:hypothetical protein